MEAASSICSGSTFGSSSSTSAYLYPQQQQQYDNGAESPPMRTTFLASGTKPTRVWTDKYILSCVSSQRLRPNRSPLVVELQHATRGQNPHPSCRGAIKPNLYFCSLAPLSCSRRAFRLRWGYVSIP
ncbi:unnamed protein product, partial [Ectocarpus sp. 13 AM-2016]